MKILKEEQIKQEELPITFITSFVSRGWEEVGMLKEQIKALKEEFGGKNITKIEEIFQGLIDAYLINIGQLELFLHENDYVEVPEIEEEKVEEPVEDAEEIEEVEPVAETEIEVEDEIEVEVEPQKIVKNVPGDFEAFEYFVDFDEPEGDPLTDDDLYR